MRRYTHPEDVYITDESLVDITLWAISGIQITKPRTTIAGARSLLSTIIFCSILAAESGPTYNRNAPNRMELQCSFSTIIISVLTGQMRSPQNQNLMVYHHQSPIQPEGKSVIFALGAIPLHMRSNRCMEIASWKLLQSPRILERDTQFLKGPRRTPLDQLEKKGFLDRLGRSNSCYYILWFLQWYEIIIEFIQVVDEFRWMLDWLQPAVCWVNESPDRYIGEALLVNTWRADLFVSGCGRNYVLRLLQWMFASFFTTKFPTSLLLSYWSISEDNDLDCWQSFSE